MKTNNYPIFAGIMISLFFLFSGCAQKTLPQTEDISMQKNQYIGKKIMYIDSYHEGYDWSDGITRGITRILGESGIEVKIHRMDTKNHPAEDFKIMAGRLAWQAVEEYQPDVLIVSDDNSFKYLVLPYYKDADLPIVFCGLNWDASLYGAPFKNTAGMVEISLTSELIEILKQYSGGDRIGYLSADTETEKKNLEYYGSLLGLSIEKYYFASTMSQWKEVFLELQDEADVIIFENNAGILDWDDDEAQQFVNENIKVPVGTTNDWMMQYAVIGMTKSPDEQGEWSGETALRIIDGESPDDIPIVTNKKGNFIINLKLGEKLDIVFKPDLLKIAEIIR
ncbi:MAG: ABC transporter substrate-binding protein [Nanoarchaeota archaeon]|nr:ABC transporter substrate-binding protein [Nanoarchaeota archaeon]